MKVIVDENKCIGCGACQAMCPNVFEFNDEGIMEVINEDIEDTLKEDVVDAKENCPVDAISIEE